MVAEQGIGLAILALLLALAARIDFRERRIPDWIGAVVLAGGLLWSQRVTGVAPADRLIGAGVAFLLFWALGEAYFRWRGVDGLGLGDAKLMAALAAWTGWQALPVLLVMASLSGLIYGVVMLRGRATVPFGPFLGLAGFLCVLALAQDGAAFDRLWGAAASSQFGR